MACNSKSELRQQLAVSVAETALDQLKISPHAHGNGFYYKMLASFLTATPRPACCAQVRRRVTLSPRQRGWMHLTGPTADIFTVASFCSEECCKKLNLPLLVYLITGSAAVPVSGHLRALRHMIDGEVDADRLDYVYRDAHHTLGGRGSPRTVIESIIYYDEFGPVFRDPGPVSEFLATRSFLWTRVYFSAENRFRMLLLITLLKGILEHSAARKFFFDIDESGEVSLEVFHKLDDISLNLKILELSEKSSLVGKLDHRAQKCPKAVAGSRERI